MRLDLTNIQINFYRLVPLAVIFWPVGNAIADHALSPLFSMSGGTAAVAAEVLVNEGDTVAGYEVTSGYDLERVHPVDGEIRPHYGVDLATPTGTKLIAPTTVEVECWWDNGGGGLVADIKPSEGNAVKMLHLSYCTTGAHSTGEAFATTGATGKGTGAHLDARRFDKQPPTLADVEPYLTGELPENIDSELSDRDLTCAIGAAEGTRDKNCNPNEHYSGHTDPGNGADNLGSFSYQHGASSPEDADRRQLARLRKAEKDLQAQAVGKFGKPLSKPALGAALDLWNQAPLAGESFVDELPSANPSTAQIVEARSRSYIDPATGKLDAPGLGNDARKVEADQARRTDEVMGQLEKTQQQRRLEQLDK